MKSRYSYYSIAVLCGLFGYGRDAYYWRERRLKAQIADQVHVLEMVRLIRKDQKKIGTPRLYRLLKPKFVKEGIKMGRDALHQLLSEHRMLVRPKKRIRPRTTWSDHWMRKWPNLIKNLEPDVPNQLWVSDITYLRLENDFCYLFLITDAYSHKIIGWSVKTTLGHEGAMKALEMALKQRIDYGKPLTHHSDRGVQYCCDNYVSRLKKAEISISMTESGDPRENAIAERVNGILKDELELDQKFKSAMGAKRCTARAVRIYNEQRPHSSCDYLFPEQAHQTTGPLKKWWKPKRSKKPNPED